MNSSFASVLSTTERNYANSLIGKEISFASENETGGRDIASGIVEQVINNVDGEIILVTANHTVALEGVISVKN
jgi:flagellar hook assembly protein FlgD